MDYSNIGRRHAAHRPRVGPTCAVCRLSRTERPLPLPGLQAAGGQAAMIRPTGRCCAWSRARGAQKARIRRPCDPDGPVGWSCRPAPVPTVCWTSFLRMRRAAGRT